jgi:DNA replication protein DnaC
LYIFGKPGVGKTHLAVGALKTIALRGYWFHFVSAADLMAKCRQPSAGTSKENADDIIDTHIYAYAYLLIDDMGIEKPSDFVHEKLYRLIDGRFAKEKPTIITSNLTLDEFGLRLGERLASRVGSDLVAEIKGDDMRMEHHNHPTPPPEPAKVEKPEGSAKVAG